MSVLETLGTIISALRTIVAVVTGHSSRKAEQLQATREAQELYEQGFTKFQRAIYARPPVSLDDPRREDLLWDAIELLRRATARFPLETGKAPSYLALGKCYERLGLIEDAVEAFSKAIECDRDLLEAFEERGLAYYGIGNYRVAKTDFEALLKRNPEHTMARERLNDCIKYLEEQG